MAGWRMLCGTPSKWCMMRSGGSPRKWRGTDMLESTVGTQRPESDGSAQCVTEMHALRPNVAIALARRRPTSDVVCSGVRDLDLVDGMRAVQTRSAHAQCIRAGHVRSACAQCMRAVHTCTACVQCVRAVHACSACGQCMRALGGRRGSRGWPWAEGGAPGGARAELGSESGYRFTF